MRTQFRIFCLGLLLSLVPLITTADQYGDFEYVSDGSAITITGYTGFGGHIEIPSTIDDLPVTVIGDYAFRYSSITGMTIPDSIITIRRGAFSSCDLTSVTIPSGVISIEYSAFSFCTSLLSIDVDAANVRYRSQDGVLFDNSSNSLLQYPCGQIGPYVVPEDVIEISFAAFAESSQLTSVVIPDSVLWIQPMAFFGCLALANVTLGNEVRLIGDEAFSGCSSLSGIHIPSTVTDIYNNAFWRCPSLAAITVDKANPSFSSRNGVLFNKGQTRLMSYPGGKLGHYSIPDTVTTVESWAFSFSPGLTGVTIPDSIVSIPNSLFHGCTNLASVSIPNTVTNIGTFAFADCSSLTTFEVPPGVTKIADAAFQRCSGLTSVYFMGPPPVLPLQNYSVFGGADQVTIYYLPNRDGWGPSLDGRPTTLWLPKIQPVKHSAGIQESFAFNVFWASGMEVVVEAATSLSGINWTPIQTNTIGSAEFFRFDDPTWSTRDSRFYRAVMR